MQDIGNTFGEHSRSTYVTLLSTDTFLEGVVMLNWSLRRVKSRYPLLVLCSDSISPSSIRALDRHHIVHLSLENHIRIDKSRYNNSPEFCHWNNTFDKLYIWTLTEYHKVVYLDSDMQVIENIDFLFDSPHMSAVRADQWDEPGIDKLNSGLIVIEPNIEEFEGMRRLWESGAINKPNAGDQDIIRAYYSGWGNHTELTLPPGLNVLYPGVTVGTIRQENVAPVKVIHYIGPRKPWMVSFRAIYRRSKNNFLGIWLIRYAVALYMKFPKRILGHRG